MAYLYKPRLSPERQRLPELYYEAARLNRNVVQLFDFAKNRSEIVISFNAGTTHKFGPKFLLNFREIVKMNYERLDEAEIEQTNNNIRRKSTHQECVWHITDMIGAMGELIDYFFEKELPSKQFLFSPQLIGFIALFEQFPNVPWNQLPDADRKLGESLFHFYDDGPVPNFSELNSTYQQRLDEFRDVHNNYNMQGRRMSFECAVIDWTFSDKEIINVLSNWIKMARPSDCKGTDDVWIDKSSYYRDIEFGASPSTMLEVLKLYYEISRDLFSNSWEQMVNISDHDPAKPFSSYFRKKKSKFVELIRNWISVNGHLPEGTGYTKRPLDLDCLIHVVMTGFNLPTQFPSAKKASHISATSIFNSPIPTQESTSG